jgi:hypothetical protein
VAKSVHESQSHIQLGRILDPLRCVRFPPHSTVRVSQLWETPDHARVLEAADVRQFHYERRGQWASFEELSKAYGQGSSNVSPLPRAVDEAAIKLVIADRSQTLQCFVTADRIYPKRAWVGALAPGWGVEMAFAVAGILNSAVGYVLYTRTARELGSQGKDLAKGVLTKLPIPLPGHKPDAFSQLALISYRLHQLYEAQAACGLDLAGSIEDHWLYLLPQVVSLYGWTEEEARRLLADAPSTRDRPGVQEVLFTRSPQSPLLPVRLVGAGETARYEQLKAGARSGVISAPAAEELTRLRDRLYWEERINRPIPSRLSAASWPGATSEQQAVRAAYGHLSRTRGQRFSAERPTRVDERLWEVPVFYSPPCGAAERGASPAPTNRTPPDKHPAGKLYVDAITGKVSDTLEGAQHAIGAQSG